MKDKFLDKLVENGTISKYEWKEKDCYGRDRIRTPHESGRNTEQLTLYFTNDNILVIDTFCSGCAENTSLVFEGQII